MKPNYFRSAAEFRRWLRRHHASARELWVGYYRKDSGKPSITWPPKKKEIRLSRLERLKELCARQRPIRQFARRPGGEGA
ncbi:MAG TPA: hypothetical protein VK864_20835 [Longimicrobiales bacterium]|nr:hypothetical protein [Longimicrobiales bacterium]